MVVIRLKRMLAVIAVIAVSLTPASVTAKCLTDTAGMSVSEIFGLLTNRADFAGYVYRANDLGTKKDRSQVLRVIVSLPSVTDVREFSIPYVRDGQIVMGSGRKHVDVSIGDIELVFLQRTATGLQANECLDSMKDDIEPGELHQMFLDALHTKGETAY